VLAGRLLRRTSTHVTAIESRQLGWNVVAMSDEPGGSMPPIIGKLLKNKGTDWRATSGDDENYVYAVAL